MNTKKNSKPTLFSFFKKITMETSFQEKKEILVQNHKNFIRNKLFVRPGNFTTFISILPFVLGFSEFLTKKYSLGEKNLFFEQNLPGITFPTQQISWETFQYLLKNKTMQNSGFATNKIIWSDRDIIIVTKDKKFLAPPIEKNLVAYINKNDKRSTNKTFIQKSYKLFLHEQNLNVIPNFYQNLDEIPIKLQSNSKLFGIENTPLNFLSNSIELNSNVINSKNEISLNQVQPKDFLMGYKPQFEIELNELSNIGIKDFYPLKQKKFIFNQFLLKNEIRKVFSSTYLSPQLFLPGMAHDSTLQVPGIQDDSNLRLPGNGNKIENIFSSKLIKWDDIDKFQNIIYEIDSISIPKATHLNRLMSGYIYPDMNQNQVFCLILQKNYSNFLNLKILLPSSYLFPQFIDLKSIPLPDYLIEIQKLILKDNLGREVFYEGPGITLDNKTGFDWKTISKNSTNLRLWLENSLGPNNPTRLQIKNFFGIFDSPENSSDTLSISKDLYLENFSLFQNGFVTNPLTSPFSFTRSFQIPAISTHEWKNYLAKNSENKDLNSVQYNTIPLPIFEVRIPNSKKPEIIFSYKNLIDFEFTHPFNSFPKLKNTPNKINFSLNGFGVLNDNSFGIQLTSGNYQKIPSLFQTNSKVFFSDTWEPLTFNSWLITAQIGFAFLVFKILKALADNYGRELLVYLLDLVALLGFLDDDLKQEIEILMGQREKGFRIISKTTKNFNNIGGIQNLLPEIIEIVWFLRNSGREFSISKTLPRGVLLTGPPGTGKTLLVQAIAGEAEVPVLALSGSSLLEPGESGALKLEILFQEARKLAPCIVFIDEMDTLAQKREQVLQNPMGADEILESLSNIKPVTNLTQPDFTKNLTENSEDISDAIFSQQDTNKEKLRILMQFLVELDGIQGRDGVIVIGATNRPEMLDPAILRPGRFDRVLNLGLPGPEKRHQILKLYSQNLGVDKIISWDYLIQRTAGYSAADLAGIMNQSTLYAILNNTHHTIETIEYGIDRITTIGIEKPQKNTTQKVLPIQIAYYQAGKILLSSLLEYHPPTLVTYLWPRRTNVRALQINTNLQKYFFRFARRIELEHRIIGCYAGKAAEILFLQDAFNLNNLSDLGTEDIQFAQNLINYMVQNWYFYSKNLPIQQNSNILDTFNEKEYSAFPDKLPFLKSILETNELSLTTKGEQFGHNAYGSSYLIENSMEQDSQQYFQTASWQYQISNEFELSTRAFADWYRLYLPDPQQTERNLEWTPPDEFYHGNNFPEKLTDTINWNQIAPIQIDYEMHSLMLQSFNKALLLLDQHREVLDKLVYVLLSAEILRKPEIEEILENFNFHLNTELSEQRSKNVKNNETEISLSWGENSRRPNIKSINLDSLKS